MENNPLKPHKPFKGFDWKSHQIELDSGAFATKEARPIEIHLKSNGTIDNKPSLTIVMEVIPNRQVIVYGQISIQMLNEGLADIGYQIVKL